MTKTIKIDLKGGIAVCTFNRPQARNAMNQQMVDELHSALDELAARSPIPVLIFWGGGGKAFVAGADIKELRDRRRSDAMRLINGRLMHHIERYPMPTIAALVGFALGGGCELALACDIRLCGRGTRLGQPEVGLGIVPGAGATYRLPRAVGHGMARELIYTGRIIDADEALRIGLVSRVVDDDEVLDVAKQIAAEIANNSQAAVVHAKMMIEAGREMSTEAAMRLEATTQAVLFEDDEKMRRMTDFIERRAKKTKEDVS